LAFQNKEISPTYLSTAIVGRDDFASSCNNLLNLFNWTSIFIVIDIQPRSYLIDSGKYVASFLANQPGRDLHIELIDASEVNWDKVAANFTKVSRGNFVKILFYFVNKL
jgi:hypothetical protein